MGRLLFWVGETTGAARQWARPSLDLSTGGWVPSAGADLYACVDEATVSDVDYIQSSTDPALDACTLQLEAVSAPVTGTITLHLRGAFV